MPNLCFAAGFTEKLLLAVNGAKSIGLTTHINPDGDGLCTCLALKRILQHLGYKADIIVDELNLDRYNYLNAIEEVITYNNDMSYELVIIIDLHDYRRLGDRVNLTEKANYVCVIDHHEIEDDLMGCSCSWVEPAAVCTGWMLHEMFKQIIKTLSSEDKLYVGNCLYTTLLNDTNNFTNANTDKHSYELSAAICNYGTKPYMIHRQFMISRTPIEMKLVGEILSTIELYEAGRILFMHSTLEMLSRNNLDDEATSNITRWVQDLKGVETIIYFREENKDNYRLSLRSKTVNVHSIAIQYEGGGHLQASGCHCLGSLADLKLMMLDKISAAEKIGH
jgi:phosphoesterase RecJ-like protein